MVSVLNKFVLFFSPPCRKRRGGFTIYFPNKAYLRKGQGHWTIGYSLKKVLLNYRKNLWKYGKTASEGMPELVEKSDIILGNEEDAETVFGIKPEGFDITKTFGNVDGGRFQSVCEQLMKKFPNTKRNSYYFAWIY